MFLSLQFATAVTAFSQSVSPYFHGLPWRHWRQSEGMAAFTASEATDLGLTGLRFIGMSFGSQSFLVF